MKYFLYKITLFVLPLSFVFLLPATILFLGREFTSYEEVAEIQKVNRDVLVGFAYNGGSFFPYKKELVRLNQPEVVALGTSRVMQFREEFFRQDAQFINAGGAGKTLDSTMEFIKDLPQASTVKVIILGIDEDVLENRHPLQEEKKELPLLLRAGDITLTMSRRIYLDYFAQKISLQGIVNARNMGAHVGISALLGGDGFRSDGSYRYGSALTDKHRDKHVQAKVASLLATYKEPQEEKIIKDISPNLVKLDQTLSLAKSKGITVVGFSPPLHPLVYDAKEGTVELEIQRRSLQEVFSRNAMYFFDMTDVRTYGATSTEFVDAVHGTDVMYAKMLLYMGERNGELKKYVDMKQLRLLLQRVKGDFFEI